MRKRRQETLGGKEDRIHGEEEKTEYTVRKSRQEILEEEKTEDTGRMRRQKIL